MSRKTLLTFILMLILTGWAAALALGENASTHQRANAFPFTLLIVDESRTFGSSIRVEVLARAINRTGLFDLSARIVEVDSSFADPLQGLEPDRRYDAILIVPRGIDDHTVRQLWIATRPLSQVSAELRQAVGLLKEIANKVFQDAAEAVDVTDDLIPGFFATIFIREGWL